MVLATVLVIVALVVPLAGANGPMGGTENVTMNMPADGSGVATRAPMPPSSTTGTVGVTATSDDSNFINALTSMLSSAPTRGARVITCVFLNAALANMLGEDFTITDSSLQLLFIRMCLQLALNMQQPQGPSARRGVVRAAGCSQQPISVPIRITKTASGYKATVKGTPSKPKNMRFRVACTRTAKSLKITLRPKTGTLAKAIGPILHVGFISRSSSPGKLKIALGVR